MCGLVILVAVGSGQGIRHVQVTVSASFHDQSVEETDRAAISAVRGMVAMKIGKNELNLT